MNGYFLFSLSILFILLSSYLQPDISHFQVKDSTDRKLFRERVHKQAKPCKVFQVIAMFQNKSSTSTYMCDLDEVDRPRNAFGKSRYIIIEGLNETEKADIISGTTTVYSAEASIRSDTLVLPRDWKSKTFVGTRVKEPSRSLPIKNYTVLTEFTSASDLNNTFKNVTYVVSQELLAASATPYPDIMFSFNATGEGTTQVTSATDKFVANNSTGASIASATLTNSSLNQTDFVTPSELSFGMRKLTPTSGVLNAIVIRVSLSNKSPSYSLGQLRDKFFGTFGDTVNLKTQLAACSRNKVTFGKMDAIEAFIPLPVSSSCYEVDRQVTTKYANQIAGYQLILIVLPSGTYSDNGNYNWLAYGYVNGYTTVYNDGVAINANVQVHEVGHNFGLYHAYHNGKEYGDMSNVVRYFSVTILFLSF